MKELVILSGKGGTGKTSLTASFAAIAQSMVLCDADVDAADLHLLMEPLVKQTNSFQGGSIAAIDQDKCVICGQCRDLCRFDAISENLQVDQIACEGCGVCVDLCPVQAIDFPVQTCGEWFISDTRFGPMVHARLGLAEENSGKLVAVIRHAAKQLAQEKNLSLIITDGPPGVGCPVIASISNADAILVVAEPTVSGIHDLQRTVELAGHFKIPTMVCVNKADLNFAQAKKIEKFANDNQLLFLGTIPFDPVFTQAMIRGQTVIEYDNTSTVTFSIKNIWEKIFSSLAL